MKLYTSHLATSTYSSHISRLHNNSIVGGSCSQMHETGAGGQEGSITLWRQQCVADTNVLYFPNDLSMLLFHRGTKV